MRGGRGERRKDSRVEERERKGEGKGMVRISAPNKNLF